MDVFTRRIIGFGVERADPCGASICRMFNQIIAGKSLPRHLSSDHDPLFRFHRWLANLRMLEVDSPWTRSFWAVDPIKLKMRSVLKQPQTVRVGIGRVALGVENVHIVIPAGPHAPIFGFILAGPIGGYDKLRN
jgi:hypothetical protein